MKIQCIIYGEVNESLNNKIEKLYADGYLITQSSINSNGQILLIFEKDEVTGGVKGNG